MSTMLDLVQQVTDLASAHRYADCAAHFAEAVDGAAPGHYTVTSRDELLRVLQSTYEPWTAITTHLWPVCEDDRRIVCEWEWSGAAKEAFPGAGHTTHPAGTRVTVRGISWWEIDGGLITRFREYRGEAALASAPPVGATMVS